MGRYQGTADNIAKRVAAVLNEKANEDESARLTAENIIGNLTEFAEDLSAALKVRVPDLAVKIEGTQWNKEGKEMVASVTIQAEGQTQNVRVCMPLDGTENTVNGKPIPRGESAMTAVYQEALRALTP
jgi:hypothetical protein